MDTQILYLELQHFVQIYFINGKTDITYNGVKYLALTPFSFEEHVSHSREERQLWIFTSFKIETGNVRLRQAEKECCLSKMHKDAENGFCNTQCCTLLSTRCQQSFNTRYHFLLKNMLKQRGVVYWKSQHQEG